MSTPNRNHYDRAKISSRLARFSIDDFKREIRNDFRNRLKELRNETVDKNRAVLQENINREFEEIKEYLREGELFDQNELFHLLDTVRKEILQDELQAEGEQHERELQQEISYILDGSSSKCSICEEITNATCNLNIICDNCAKHFE